VWGDPIKQDRPRPRLRGVGSARETADTARENNRSIEAGQGREGGLAGVLKPRRVRQR
jgi:hypothetical protein